MERKKIGKGSESFEKLINEDKYYVDKTAFIKTVFGDSGAEIILITRPRRFGKTLTMKTFESFLSLNPDNPGDTSKQQKLFAGTHILSDDGTPDEVSARKRFVQNFMGKYPVIFLTLKSVDGLDFKSAYGRFADNIVFLAEQYEYLQKSEVLTPVQKESLARLTQPLLMRNPEFADDLKSSLRYITSALFAHHGKPPVILIDEYDVPLAKAEAHGYYEEMLELIRAFLDPLKTNTNFSKAVLTGCLRVSKESIFTGLNSFAVNSIFDKEDVRYSSAIGFTKEETEEMLDYYGLGQYKSEVRENYDGYRFGRVGMFCPWDVVSFCYDAVTITDGDTPLFKNYWINTSGNQIIDEFADYIKSGHIDDMQSLVDGKSISAMVLESLNYPDLKQHEIDAFWTMLLYTGYLTLEEGSSFDLNEPQLIKIPNLEIRECFAERILRHFRTNPQVVNGSIALAKACLAGDASTVRKVLKSKLKLYISVRDLAAKAPQENLYHGFLSGCLSSCSGIIADFNSNHEAGDGYADITFKSADEDVGVVIELKQTKDDMKTDELADSAVEQIEQKNYARIFMAKRDIKAVYAYGICFCRKSCSVTVKKLK